MQTVKFGAASGAHVPECGRAVCGGEAVYAAIGAKNAKSKVYSNWSTKSTYGWGSSGRCSYTGKFFVDSWWKTGKLHGFSYYLKLNISQNRDNERNLQNFCKATFSCHVKQQFDSRALYISARLILSTHLTHKSFEM